MALYDQDPIAKTSPEQTKYYLGLCPDIFIYFQVEIVNGLSVYESLSWEKIKRTMEYAVTSFLLCLPLTKNAADIPPEVAALTQ